MLASQIEKYFEAHSKLTKLSTFALLVSTLTASAIFVGVTDLLLVNMFTKLKIGSDYNLLTIYAILSLLIIRQASIASVSFLAYKTSSYLVDSSILNSIKVLLQNIIPNGRFDSKFATTFGVKSAFVYPFFKAYSSIVIGCSSFFILFIAVFLELGEDFILFAGVGAFILAAIFFFLRYAMDYLANRYQESQGKMNDSARIFPRHLSNLTKNFSNSELLRFKSRSNDLRFLEMAQDFVATLPKFFLELMSVLVLSLIVYFEVDFANFSLFGIGYASFRLVTSAQMILNGIAIYRFNEGIVGVFRNNSFFLENETTRDHFEKKLNQELVIVGDNLALSLSDFRSTVVDAENNKFILIGESGTGKSLFARALQLSLLNRGDGCAFIDANLYVAEQGTTVRDLFLRFFSEEVDFGGLKSTVTKFIEGIWLSDVHSLSLGQRMRVNVMFYILLGYKSLILDEVLSTLDLDNKIILLDFLKSVDLDLLIFVDHNIAHLDLGLPIYQLKRK